MKYQRITQRRETPLVMSMWAGDSHSLKIYNRLAELEDKIERGELIDRNEEKVIKEVAIAPVREILNRMFQIIGRSQDKPEYRNRLTSDMLDAIDEFADKYDVELVDYSEE